MTYKTIFSMTVNSLNSDPTLLPLPLHLLSISALLATFLFLEHISHCLTSGPLHMWFYLFPSPKQLRGSLLTSLRSLLKTHLINETSLAIPPKMSYNSPPVTLLQNICYPPSLFLSFSFLAQFILIYFFVVFIVCLPHGNVRSGKAEISVNFSFYCHKGLGHCLRVLNRYLLNE